MLQSKSSTKQKKITLALAKCKDFIQKHHEEADRKKTLNADIKSPKKTGRASKRDFSNKENKILSTEKIIPEKKHLTDFKPLQKSNLLMRMTRQPRNIANPIPLNITKSNIELDFDYIA